MNNLKADIYRFYHSKGFLVNIVVICIYTFFVFLLYYIDHLPYREILVNFNDEYHLLFIILTFSFSSSILISEMTNLTIYNYPRKKLVKIKSLEIILDILFIIITTLVINILIVSILDFKSITQINLFKIVVNNYKVLYEYVFFNLLVLLLNSLFKSSSKVLIMAYLLYIIYSYSKQYIIRFKVKQLYFLCFLNQVSAEYKTLKSQLNYGTNCLVFLIIIIVIYYLTKWLILKRKD